MAARRSQEEQDFSDWVGRWKRDPGPAERVAVQKQLKKARAKFEEIDSHGDGNGVLNGAELEDLARWVFSGFHPAGEQLDAQQLQAEVTELLARLDKNRDGVLGFDEFADWFTFTCAEMHRYRQQRSSVHEFVQTFQDKVTTLPTCVCFLPDCLAPSASPH